MELLDSGKDETTGNYFLVLEWMDKNLETLVKESPADGWDSFWEAVALPVLEALAFSHSRRIHGDIKPSNIIRRQTDRREGGLQILEATRLGQEKDRNGLPLSEPVRTHPLL